MKRAREKLSSGKLRVSLLLSLSVLAGGCAGGSGGESTAGEGMAPGAWTPSAAPTFAVINRESLFALAHSDESDALVYEQTEFYGRPLTPPRSWVIVLPQTARRNLPLDLGETGGGRAWALVSFDGAARRAIEAHGSVTVLSSDGESLTAQVNLTATGPAPTAGYAQAQRAGLDGRIVFLRATPATMSPPAPTTTSGIAPPARRTR